MIKTESKAIGDRGYTYTTQQLGAREGGRTLVRLAKLLGKPVGDAVSAGEELDLRNAGSIITGLAESLSEAEYERLCDTFAKRTTVSGGASDQPTALQYGSKNVPLSDGGIFDLHFAGAYAELLGWLKFALEVNYGSFLAVATSATKGITNDLRVSDVATADAAPQSTSPPT